MSSKLDQFVDLFPIHPSYIDVFNKLYLIENRHILKNISLVIKDIFDKEVPANAPVFTPSTATGLPSRQTDCLKQIRYRQGRRCQLPAGGNHQPCIPEARIQAAGHQDHLRIERTSSAEQRFDAEVRYDGREFEGRTVPVSAYARAGRRLPTGHHFCNAARYLSTVSGQFAIHDEGNNQYYIDVNKVVDYDEKSDREHPSPCWITTN